MAGVFQGLGIGGIQNKLTRGLLNVVLINLPIGSPVFTETSSSADGMTCADTFHHD